MVQGKTTPTSVSLPLRNTTDLIRTGLLEGVRVYYKSINEELTYGTIQGEGIVCLCSKCKGQVTEAINPSNFEVHIRGRYYHATEYICFDNGKSLLGLWNACKGVRERETLELIIEDYLSAPGQELIIQDDRQITEQMSELNINSSSKKGSKRLREEIDEKDAAIQYSIKEYECLNLKVAELEKNLEISNSTLERKDAELEELREKLKESERKHEQAVDLLKNKRSERHKLQGLCETERNLIIKYRDKIKKMQQLP